MVFTSKHIFVKWVFSAATTETTAKTTTSATTIQMNLRTLQIADHLLTLSLLHSLNLDKVFFMKIHFFLFCVLVVSKAQSNCYSKDYNLNTFSLSKINDWTRFMFLFIKVQFAKKIWNWDYASLQNKRT